LLHNKSNFIKDYHNKNLVKVNKLEIKCFKCNKIGHIAKYCRSKPQEQKYQEEEKSPTNKSYNFRKPENKTNVSIVNLAKSPHIKVTYDNREYNILIDTGAGVSLIKRKVIYESDLDKQETIWMKGIGKTSRKSLGVARIPIEIKFQNGFTSKQLVKFQVVQNDSFSEFDGILGTDFIQENSYVIDYSNKMLRNNRNNIRLIFGNYVENISYINQSRKRFAT